MVGVLVLPYLTASGSIKHYPPDQLVSQNTYGMKDIRNSKKRNHSESNRSLRNPGGVSEFPGNITVPNG